VRDARPATDRAILLACAFLRAVAVGAIAVEIGLFLAGRGFKAGAIGAVVGSGLAGAALAALAATRFADRRGRRRILSEVALLGAAGAAAMAIAPTPLLAGVAAFAGMVNGMGRDRGASLVVEQAILPQVVGDRGRTRILAWYNVLQDAGHALGALLAGAPATLVLYVALLVGVAGLARRLSPAVEAETPSREKPPPVSPTTRRRLVRISALFALDSLGGGFLTTALLSYFFAERFDAAPAAIGLLFFGARVLNALSHLAAAWLAARIGLVNTMVFTHVPSSLLLLTVAWAPSFEVAAALFLLREGLVEMDVPTRQSYVLAIVAPHERTFASGVTALVRMAAWAAGPFVAGPLMEGERLAAPLAVGAVLKIAYDLMLYRAFRRIRPPEEAPGPAVG
jgi:MFS family permease